MQDERGLSGMWGRRFALAAGLTALLLSSCGTHTSAPPVTAGAGASKPGDSGNSSATPVMAPIASGTALPPGYKIDPARTMVFGTDENWTGRLAYTTSTPADEVFDFLHREMPNFGWTETTAMRSDVSLISFVSMTSNRAATIHIERGSALSGSTRVEMVVSPSNLSSAGSRSVRSTPAR